MRLPVTLITGFHIVAHAQLSPGGIIRATALRMARIPLASRLVRAWDVPEEDRPQDFYTGLPRGDQ
jgi:hypothetical protein